mgnify:CR=1 FL=1
MMLQRVTVHVTVSATERRQSNWWLATHAFVTHCQSKGSQLNKKPATRPRHENSQWGDSPRGAFEVDDHLDDLAFPTQRSPKFLNEKRQTLLSFLVLYFSIALTCGLVLSAENFIQFGLSDYVFRHLIIHLGYGLMLGPFLAVFCYALPQIYSFTIRKFARALSNKKSKNKEDQPSKQSHEKETVRQSIPPPAKSARSKLKIKTLFVVPYEDMEGNLRRRWYGTMRDAKKGHAWFKKAQRHGHAQNLYPPMEQLVPEIDACPATKNELVEALNLSASYEDSS